MGNKLHLQWNPWHGCHKCSEGCLNCYVYYLDSLHNRDASIVSKNKSGFTLPIGRDRNHVYKIPSGSEVYTCFTSDFFIEEADPWRPDAWEMIHERSDVTFLIPTKRVNRILKVLPNDWNNGYDNVIIAATAENQARADERLPMFLELPLKHREIFISPILEYVDVSRYISTGEIDLVSVGGESYPNSRVCEFDWVKQIWGDCNKYDTPFVFHQTGARFAMNGHEYHIPHDKEYSQAQKASAWLDQQRPTNS